MAEDTFTSLFGDLPVSTVYVGTQPDQLRSVTDQIDELATGYSNISVSPGNLFGEIIGSLFDFAIDAVVALLGMSVIIAVIGIVNTLSLSIFEQRREIAMLRAIGMLPRDVRSMVRLEAVLISMVGTLTGLTAGVFLAFFVTRPIDVGLSWQLPRLGIILVLGVLVGFLAALAPARRVSRIDLLQALQA
jgi:putative ABC transport system permease protein